MKSDRSDGHPGTGVALARSATMRYRPQVLTIIFSTAAFVAMWLAEALRSVAVPPVYVVFVGLVMSAFLVLVIASDVLISWLERTKR